MRIAIVDGTAELAPNLIARLVDDGHEPAGIVTDLDEITATRLTEEFGDADAVVCVPDGPDVALVVDATQLAGILRFVLITADEAAQETAYESALDVAVVTPDRRAVDAVAAALD